MRKATQVSLAALVVGVCGLAASASPVVRVLADAGAAGGLAGDNAGAVLLTIDHASASPCGQIVVVGKTSNSSAAVQNIWTMSADEKWTLRTTSGATPIAGLSNGLLTGMLQGVPVLSNCGDLMLIANAAGDIPGATGGPVITPTVIRVDSSNFAHMNLRLNVASGPGVPATGVVRFSGPSADRWRLADTGAMFAASSRGIFAGVGAPDLLEQLTAVTPQGATGPGGMTVSIGTAGESASSSSGYRAQRIASAAYGQDGMAGILLFSPLGTGSMPVRDGASPIEGLSGQVVLSSTSTVTVTGIAGAGSRMGINSHGDLAFLGRFGAPQPSSGGVGNVPQSNPAAGAPGLFIKSPGSLTRLIAQVGPDDAPGLPGWHFTSFGSPVINSQGRLAFLAQMSGPFGSRSSIWTTDADGTPRVIALSGPNSGPGTPPAQAGTYFVNFMGEPSINRFGQIEFIATVGPGPTLSGVFGFDPTLGLTMLAGSGQTVTGRDGLPHVLSLSTMPEIGGAPMLPSGNDDGLPTTITDTGAVIFRANLAGVGAAVFTATIPSPTGACCVGSTCEVRPQTACGTSGTSFSGVGTVCRSLSLGVPAASCCAADFDHNGAVTLDDLFGFIGAWMSRDPIADADQSGSIGLDDLFTFISGYTTGCAPAGTNPVSLRR